MRILTIARATTLTLGVLLASSAAATRMDYAATAAETDEYSIFNGGQALWLPGLANFGNHEDTGWLFAPRGSGRYTFDTETRSASVTGRVVNRVDSDYAFDIVLDFMDAVDYDTIQRTSPSSPKLELDDSAYVGNGGSVDPRSWTFFTAWGGVMNGVAGTVTEDVTITLTQFGEAAQVGIGASGKNIELGLSSWFNWQLDGDAPGLVDVHPDTYGDLNVNLRAAPEATLPEPAGMLLVGLGLVGLACTRRRAR